ncbi:MAG: DUF1080 domain-containing protein [Candidatus Hydrogenedens sp.]|nr:DUF1080 domain-containing protein [Candidatus Hydrogenedens sp.]
MRYVSMAGLMGAAGVLVAGAASAELPAPAEKKVDFQADIWPIFEASCVECHGTEKKKSGLRLDNKADALKGGTEGAMFVAGDSAGSLIVQLVAGINDDFDRMPPDGDPLTDEQIGILRAWIDQGAEWPDDGAPAAAPAGEYPAVAQAAGLPETWKVEATNQEGPLATWELSKDLKGPAGEPVIALSSANHKSAGTFNLLWTDSRPFKDGSFEVTIKSLSGEEDQGGGVIWRVKDKNNYYVARYNPLEGNFRIYKVVEGNREQIGSADIKPEGEWVTLKIEQTGNAIAGYINGEKLIDATDDALAEAGGAGYWTKADAATAFMATKLNPAS